MLKKIIVFLIILAVIGAILNIPVKFKQGINYELKVFKIPLYTKISGFLYRDYWYKRFSREIVAESLTEKDKALAIFNWVKNNIHPIPERFDVIDDHTLDIIIRRYGAPDQMADVFSTLCLYSGIPAFGGFDIEKSEKKKEYKKYKGLAFALLENKWRVFDFHHGVYFYDKNGEIASISDVISGDFALAGDGGGLTKSGYDYFFRDLKPVEKDFISKAEKQMPALRIKYEIQRILKGRSTTQ